MQRLKILTNNHFQNLATADLLFIVTCIPPTAIDYAVGWPLNDLWCKIVQDLINVTTYMSVYTLVLLSLDRYLVRTKTSVCEQLMPSIRAIFTRLRLFLYTLFT